MLGQLVEGAIPVIPEDVRPSLTALNEFVRAVGALFREVGDIPLRDLTVGRSAKAVLEYYDRIASVLREVGYIPQRDLSLVDADDITLYYSVIAGFLREVGTPIAAPDSCIIRAADMYKYYGRQRDARAYGTEHAMQCKLVLLGEPLAGKTSLLRALQERHARPTGAAERTLGADVYTWRPFDEIEVGTVVARYRVTARHGDDSYRITPVDERGTAGTNVSRDVSRDELLPYMSSSSGVGGEKAQLVVNAFDMGGQVAFRATQQVHIAGDTLYLLVLRGSDGAEVAVRFAGMWLRNLCARSPGPRVRVVVTHGDEMSAEQQGDIRVALVTCIDWTAFGVVGGPSSASDVAVVSSVGALTGVDELREAILLTMLDEAQFPGVRMLVPLYYARVHASVRRLRRAGATVLDARELLSKITLPVILTDVPDVDGAHAVGDDGYAYMSDDDMVCAHSVVCLKLF